MSYIQVPDDLPGIRGLLAFKPATGAPVAQLIHELLRGHSPLSEVEREMIAAHVSGLNECEFCARSHAAALDHLDHRDGSGPAAPSSRLSALLVLAEAVVHGGHHVTDQLVATARAAGAGDEEIHDTVLIASAFCMLNRYVDGLKAITPHDQAAYDAMGVQMALHGYLGAAPSGDRT
jgi:alkylhydroperoxidase family enzyme